MSERPENPQNQDLTPSGGWHSPSGASPWQEPETQVQERVAWREMSALPEELDQEPAEQGMWHRPDDDDTIFTDEDIVEVSDKPREVAATSPVASVRPEDLIAEIIGGTQRQANVPNPEDFDYGSSSDDEDATQAADAIQAGDTLLVDEVPFDDDEEGNTSISAMLALASLAQGDEDDFAGLNAADLTPTERAMFNVASNIQDEMDSQQLSEPDIPEDATVTMEDTSAQPASQAEDYARQQLEQLNQQNEGDSQQFGGFGQEQAVQEPQYSTAEIELAQQFRETQRQAGVLRQMQAQGQIDPQELQARLQQLAIYDEQNGTWWNIGVETNTWYRYNNQTGAWDEAQPPVPLNIGQMRTETGIGQTAPDVMPDSLPYLPDDGSQTLEFSDQDTQYDPTDYYTAQNNYSNQYGADPSQAGYSPPPEVDPNLTMVGPSADMTQIGLDPTYQNFPQVDPNATIQSDPFASGGQNTMPSASLGDLVYDDGYENQGIPQAEPAPRDTGFTDYGAEVATPTVDDIEGEANNRVLAFIGIGAFVIAVFGILLFGGVFLLAQNQYNQVINEWRDEIDALGTADFDFQTATILAADNNIIAELTGEEGARTIVSIENGDVSPFFVHAIVSSEDPTFYENSGVSFLAILRAFVQNFLAGEVTSGASTITQQIVRDRVLGSNVVSLDRKFVEALVAIEVANTYSKNEILDIYINEFFYGQQSYGVEAAAEFYFDTTAAELNAAESATLVGLLPSPSDTNPVVAPTVSFSNMRVILDRMEEAECLNFQHGQWSAQGVPFCFNENLRVDDGRGGETLLYRKNPDGSYGGFLSLQIAEVETRRYTPRQLDILYPHFVYYVLAEVDAAFGNGAYTERGFTIQTTLIPRIQNTAEAALEQGVDQFALNGVRTGAALVLDPRTGAIVSMVGSPDFNDEDIDGQVNNTVTLQQPGSAIKPVVYAMALAGTPEDGYLTPASILWDVPTQYNIDGTVYAPTNFDGRFRGPVALRYSLAQSLNVPAIKAYIQFGSLDFVNTATAMGIVFDQPNDDLTPTFGLPTAIGATEVTLMDLTQAYSVIANDGAFVEPYSVEAIAERNTDGNEQLVELINNLVRPEQTQILSPQVAYLLQNILSDDVARSATVNGTPSTFPANSLISGSRFGLNDQGQVAAKTGTNNTAVNNQPSRLWTVGFTNNYSVGVWLGSLNQATPLTGQITGFRGAAPVWEAIMREAINGQNPGSFDTPSGVVQDAVCQLTGTLAPQNATCPQRVTEIYAQNQPPPAQEDGFVAVVPIDSWTGLRSNQWCPENVVTETFANISDQFAVNWLNTTTQGQNILSLLNLPANLPPPPTNECQQGQALPTVQINFPQENTTLEGIVAVTGQVSTAELQRWELQISEVGTDNFRSIMPQASTSQIPTAGSILYEWDSTTVQNGAYILRLAAFSQSGGFIFREVRVTLNNPEPTPVPPTPTPFVIEPVDPIPFDELPTSTPDPINNP